MDESAVGTVATERKPAGTALAAQPPVAVSSAAPTPAWVADALEILRCPITHRELRLATSAEIDTLNQRIAASATPSHDGTRPLGPLEAALVSADGTRAYPIVDGIVILLRTQAIDIRPDRNQPGSSAGLCFEKRQAQAFYDTCGWQRRSKGEFIDAALHEDLRPIPREYLRRCNRRVTRFLPACGKYLLDAASGPVQFSEYLEYSKGFTYRVCVDLSFVALAEARRRLGSHGIYILADITDLPFRDSALDAVVSLHTVYHVPRDEQAAAAGELVRVTTRGGVVVVVYSAGDRCLLMKLPLMRFGALRPLQERLSWYARRIKEVFGGRPAHPRAETAEGRPQLYFHAHSLAWWRAQLRGIDYELRCWRSVHTDFMKLYVHRHAGGRVILALLFWLEKHFPRLFGRIGQYPMFVIRKR